MQFNLDLPATVTFDYPSVNSLVDYIYGQMTLVAPLAKPSSSVPYSHVRSALHHEQNMSDGAHVYLPATRCHLYKYQSDLLVLYFMKGQSFSVDALVNELQDIIKDVLGVVVSPQQPLMEVGLDSLIRDGVAQHYQHPFWVPRALDDFCL